MANPKHARRCAEALGQHFQEVSREACHRARRAALRVLDGCLQRLQTSLAATIAADAALARRAVGLDAVRVGGPAQGRAPAPGLPAWMLTGTAPLAARPPPRRRLGRPVA